MGYDETTTIDISRQPRRHERRLEPDPFRDRASPASREAEGDRGRAPVTRTTGRQGAVRRLLPAPPGRPNRRAAPAFAAGGRVFRRRSGVECGGTDAGRLRSSRDHPVGGRRSTLSETSRGAAGARTRRRGLSRRLLPHPVLQGQCRGVECGPCRRHHRNERTHVVRAEPVARIRARVGRRRDRDRERTGAGLRYGSACRLRRRRIGGRIMPSRTGVSGPCGQRIPTCASACDTYGA